MIQSTCPSEDTLNRLLSDVLEDSRYESLNQHLEECIACQSRLDALTDSPVGVSLPVSNEHDAAISKLVSRLSSLSPSELESLGSGTSSTIRFPGPPTADAPLGELGEYQIQELIGSGASGLLYRAVDPRINREVAIKVLRSELASHEESRRRLKREARAVAGLNHEGVVRLFEFGDTPEFPPYLVMEYIEGESIGQRLKRSPVMPAKEAVDLAIPIARALAAAHEFGLVHRDVKPSNILLDENQNPKVVDFGLALLDDGNASLTREGALAGTPAYISPEQILDPHHVDGRTDTYSLGVVLYRMLTGQLPFQGVARMTLLAVLQKEPPSPRQYNDEIPRDVETIVLKAMSKDRDKRYATADEFADDLQRWAIGEPILARPVGRVERIWRWCKRKPMIAILLATVASLLLTVTIGSVIASINLSAARDEAEGQRDVAIETLESLIDEVRFKLFEETTFTATEAETALLEISVRGFREITKKNDDSGRLNISTAEANIQFGAVLVRNEDLDQANIHFEEAREILESLGGEDSQQWPVVEQVIELLQNQSCVFSFKDEHRRAGELLLEALRIAKKAHQRWPENFEAHFAVANAHELVLSYPAILQGFPAKGSTAAEAIKVLKELQAKNPGNVEVARLLISIYYSLANYALVNKDYSTVVKNNQAVLEQYDSLHARGGTADQYRNMAVCAHYDLGNTYKTIGDKENALKHSVKFLEWQAERYYSLFTLSDLQGVQREVDELRAELKKEAGND